MWMIAVVASLVIVAGAAALHKRATAFFNEIERITNSPDW